MDANIPAVPATPVVNATPAADVKAPAIRNEIGKGAVESKVADTKAPVDGKAPVPATKAEAEVIRKIKVGDMEYDETTLASMIEKSKGADKKFLEAAKQRKEAVKFFKLAKENPREFLAKTGLDPQKFAYDEVAKDIKNKLRDPRDVQIEEAQERIKAYEEREAAEKAKIKADKETQAAKAFEQQLHAKMIEAMEASPTIPKNGFTVAKIAKYLETVYNKTGTMLEPKDVVKVIERDIHNETRGILQGATAEQIIALIGEEGMAAIRQYDLAKLKDPLKGGQHPGGQKPPQQERKRVRSNEFWKEIDRQAKAERGE